ncbi:hypothetical protein [Thalassomonas haliotis]|uniref:Uncharacterized protein n=1 Tax=Thalassomonas haliotis TaxID=485448 RepID=A0ABY7VAQ3_9GAMM|nr:hypothetical protein [Thalassomonas haliotis]WDE10386.1 hypothetical protein H3N35_19210 [Thalassomonas haliotis]
MLEWDETEFTGILEVIPEAIEDDAGGPFYVFNVSNNGVELELTVFPFEEDVRFRLFRSGENHSLLEYQIMGCKFARHHIGSTGNNSYLSFISKTGIEVTVIVKPDIQVLINE